MEMRKANLFIIVAVRLRVHATVWFIVTYVSLFFGRFKMLYKIFVEYFMDLYVTTIPHIGTDKKNESKNVNVVEDDKHFIFLAGTCQVTCQQ